MNFKLLHHGQNIQSLIQKKQKYQLKNNPPKWEKLEEISPLEKEKTNYLKANIIENRFKLNSLKLSNKCAFIENLIFLFLLQFILRERALFKYFETKTFLQFTFKILPFFDTR